jgi:putative sigma-54 modulation protein
MSRDGPLGLERRPDYHGGPKQAEEGAEVRIEIRTRNTTVTDNLRAHVEKCFGKVSKQVSDLARLELELLEEKNPAIADGKVAEATLYLKGVTLRARESSTDLRHSIDLVADKLARQVKRHRDKRRARRERAAEATP